MDFPTIVGLAALVLLALVCTLMILWCKYNDGIIGKIGFAMIVIGAMVLIAGEVDDPSLALSPAEAFIFIGTTIVFVRHVWRRLPRMTGRAQARRRADRS